MTFIPLSEAEWEEINTQVPNIELLRTRIFELPLPDWLLVDDETERIRSSNVCLRDAGRFLDAAQYALGLALGVRKYHMKVSQSKQDENWFLAYRDSQFYVDYVPLLLYSPSEHALTALDFLIKVIKREGEKPSPKPNKKNRKYFEQKEAPYKKLESILENIDNNPNVSSLLHEKLKNFQASSARKAIWKYRNDWVHNKPKRIESPFFDPPRRRNADTETIIGVKIYSGSEPPDYSWDKLIDLLKQALSDTHDLLTVCVDEWEHFYNDNVSPPLEEWLES